MTDTLEQVSFRMILHGGSARSLAYEAFELAISGDFAGAHAKLKEAEQELGASHSEQMDLIQKEAQGQGVSPNLLLIHAQDHLMTAMAEVNLVERLIRVLEVRR